MVRLLNIITALFFLHVFFSTPVAASCKETCQQFVKIGNSISEKLIDQHLAAIDRDPEYDAEIATIINEELTQEKAHKAGLVQTSRDLLYLLPQEMFKSEFKRRLFQALKDFKRCAHGTIFSLDKKSECKQSILFPYQTVNGNVIQVTTYSMFAEMLDRLDEKLQEGFKDMSSLRSTGALKEFKLYIEKLATDVAQESMHRQRGQ